MRTPDFLRGRKCRPNILALHDVNRQLCDLLLGGAGRLKYFQYVLERLLGLRGEVFVRKAAVRLDAVLATNIERDSLEPKTRTLMPGYDLEIKAIAP